MHDRIRDVVIRHGVTRCIVLQGMHDRDVRVLSLNIRDA